jgi:hypothetical protein
MMPETSSMFLPTESNQLLADTPSMTSSRKSGGLIVGAVLTGYSIVLGNPLSVQAIDSVGRDRRAYGLLPLLSYLKWTGPMSDRGVATNLMRSVYWPDLMGPEVLRSMNIRRERHAHWIAANFRTVTMIVLAALFVHAVLRSVRTSGVFGRWVAVSGAVMCAGAISSLLGTALFALSGGRPMNRGFIDPMIGALGLGVTFGLMVGIPVGLLVALMERNRVDS